MTFLEKLKGNVVKRIFSMNDAGTNDYIYAQMNKIPYITSYIKTNPK